MSKQSARGGRFYLFLPDFTFLITPMLDGVRVVLAGYGKEGKKSVYRDYFRIDTENYQVPPSQTWWSSATARAITVFFSLLVLLLAYLLLSRIAEAVTIGGLSVPLLYIFLALLAIVILSARLSFRKKLIAIALLLALV